MAKQKPKAEPVAPVDELEAALDRPIADEPAPDVETGTTVVTDDLETDLAQLDPLTAEEEAAIAEKFIAVHEEVAITLPVETSGPEGYVSTHVEARLSPKQAQGLHKVWRALETQAARTQDGKPVRSRADAVRWILEAVADA